MIEGEISAECRAFLPSIEGKSLISSKKIFEMEEGVALLSECCALGVLSPMGENSTRFAVNSVKISELLSDTAKAGTPLNGGKTRLTNPKIVGKKQKSTMESLMAEISAMDDLPCLKGDERLNAISKAVTRLQDEISRFNQALTVLDGKSRIKFSSTPATIEEVVPEGDGLGGIKISYRNQTLVGVWEDGIDQVWLDQKVEKVSDWLADRLANNVRIAQKQKH